MPPKSSTTGNRSLHDFFKPKMGEPPAKRARTDAVEKPPSPSPTPSPAMLVSSSAEQGNVAKPLVTDANASFTSMRSSTSSRRVVTSSGQEVVMGSDSDTDDLDAMDTILKNLQAKSKPTNLTRTTTTTASGNVVPNKQERKKKYTFNLSRLVEEQRQATAMEVRIAEAEANLHEADMEKARAGSPDKNTMRAVLTESNNTEDTGRARRVMEALERTDAFERQDVWKFFEDQPPKPPKNPFPRISHPNAMLTETLNNPERRQLAFTSGFLQRIAGPTGLPDELLSWLLIEVCREEKDILLTAYIETLVQAVTAESTCLSAAFVKRCLRILGANLEIMDPGSQIRYSRVALNASLTSLHPNLGSFLQLMNAICHKLPPPSKEMVGHFLVRAVFDQSVLSDASVHERVESCFSTLLDIYSETDNVSWFTGVIAGLIYNAIDSPTLRLQLVNALPAATPNTHLFRRKLALAFILDKERHLNAELTNPALTARMLLLFQKGGTLRPTATTDYQDLRARLSLLDIALDIGFSDFDFLETRDKAAEKQFNESIDRLAATVRETAARIIDAGAAHMARTEAKVVAERLVQRLEFAVRTREKPVKDWFGEVEREGKKEFMKGWVNGAKKEELAEETQAVGGATGDEKEVNKHGPPPRQKPLKVLGHSTNESHSVEEPAESIPAVKSLVATPQKTMAIRGGSASPAVKDKRKPIVMMKW